MAQQRETDALSSLLVDIGLKDDLTPAMKETRAGARKLRDDIDELAGAVAKGDAHYSEMKATLEKIRDPMRRAAVAQRLLNKQHQNQIGLLDKLVDRGREFQIDLKSQGAAGTVAAAGLQAAGAAAVALGAAITAFAVDSMKKYIDGTAETMMATQALSTSFNDLQMSMGEALLGPPDEAAASIGNLTQVVKDLDKEVTANSKKINTWVKEGIEAASTAISVLSFTTAAALTPLTLLIDGFTGLYSVGQVLTGVIAEDLGPALANLGLITEESGEAVKAWGTEVVESGEDYNAWTDDLWDGRDAMLSFTDAVVTGSGGLDTMDEAVGQLDDSLIDMKTTLEELSKLGTIEFLEKLGSAQLGPLRSPGETPKAKKKKGGRAARKPKEELSATDEFFAGGFVGDLEDDARKETEAAKKRQEAWQREIAELAKAAAEALGDTNDALKGTAEAMDSAFAKNIDVSDLVNSSINSMTDSFVDLGAAIMSGEQDLGSFGKAALAILGDTFSTLGKGMISAGIAVKGLWSLNPYLLLAGGAGLLVAGAAMKRSAAAGADKASSGGGASTSGGSTLEAFGRAATERDLDREEGGTTNIFIGDREIKDFVVEANMDAMRRNQYSMGRAL